MPTSGGTIRRSTHRALRAIRAARPRRRAPLSNSPAFSPGEIAGGYAEREYADPRLAKLHGPTFDSSLVWSATPLTTVTLKGTTTLAETTVADASGAVSRTISLELAHQLFTNLKLDAVASYATNTYQGVSLLEKTYAGTFSAEYDLSRSIVLKASVAQQRFHSTAVGADYTETKFLVGLKLQR